MGDISIRFRMNMRSGKKDIYIDYESDDDAMRHEHEKGPPKAGHFSCVRFGSFLRSVVG